MATYPNCASNGMIPRAPPHCAAAENRSRTSASLASFQNGQPKKRIQKRVPSTLFQVLFGNV